MNSFVHRQSLGITLIESLLVIGVIGILMSAIVPYFITMNKAWTVANRQDDMMQNGRMGLAKMVQELRQANQIVSVTGSGNLNGSLIFIDKNFNRIEFKRYTNASNKSMLGYVKNGSLSELAGPISRLVFTAKTTDLSATQVDALVRSVDIAMDVVDDQGFLSPQTVQATVYFRKKFLGSFYKTCFAKTDITLANVVTISGNVHANHQVDLKGATLQGLATDSDDGISIAVPTLNLSTYTAAYDPCLQLKPSATIILNANTTFVQGQTYTGFYYISGGFSATVEKNVVFNGTLVAEGDISIDGNNVTFTPSGGNPAIVAGKNFTIVDFQDGHFECYGTIYAKQSISCNGRSATFHTSPGRGIAMASGGTLVISGRTFTSVGALIAKDDLSFANTTRTMTLTQTNGAALLSEKSITCLGKDFVIDGVVFAKGDVTFSNNTTAMTGMILSGGNLSIAHSATIAYKAGYFYAPPPFFKE